MARTMHFYAQSRGSLFGQPLEAVAVDQLNLLLSICNVWNWVVAYCRRDSPWVGCFFKEGKIHPKFA